MDSKRQYSEHEEEGDQTQQNSKRKRQDNTQKPGTFSIIIGNLRIELDIEKDIMPRLAALSQRVVHEVVESKLLRPNIDEIGPSEAKFFKLVFMNELPATIFTLSKIKAKDGKPVEIVLYDVRSDSIVTDGPMSCMEIKICVLNSEFGSNEDWTTQEFKAKILRQRDSKGQLLKGNTVIRMENGVGCINNTIKFTDNSSWTRSRHFKLGAMVQSASNEAHTKEAISEPFMVKDSRGEVNQKHYPPSLNDEIWRLKNISKDGKIHERLSGLGIDTVEDLLRADPSSLQEKNGNISRKLQEAINHAKTCNQKPLAASLQILGQLPAARQDFGEASTSTSVMGEMCMELMEGNEDFVIVGSNIVPTEVPGGVNSENGFPNIQFANDFDFSSHVGRM